MHIHGVLKELESDSRLGRARWPNHTVLLAQGCRKLSLHGSNDRSTVCCSWKYESGEGRRSAHSGVHSCQRAAGSCCKSTVDQAGRPLCLLPSTVGTWGFHAAASFTSPSVTAVFTSHLLSRLRRSPISATRLRGGSITLFCQCQWRAKSQPCCGFGHLCAPVSAGGPEPALSSPLLCKS